jgi:hypothetical protein
MGNDEEGHGGDKDFPSHDEGGEDARHGGEDPTPYVYLTGVDDLETFM